MQKTKSVCVVIPCYKPLAGWEARLRAAFEAFEVACADLEVHIRLSITIDGSSDTVDLERLSALVPYAELLFFEKNHGKGHALRAGVAAHRADYYITTDVDFPYTTESMRRILDVLLQHGGIAAGNRSMQYYASVPRGRMLISKTLRWLLKFFLRLPVTDSQCGLKGFDVEGKTLFLETTINRFLFDLEFLMLAHKKIGVRPVPVALKEGVTFSRMPLRILLGESHNFLQLFLKNIFKGNSK